MTGLRLRRQSRRLAADLSLEIEIMKSLAETARTQGEDRLLAIANFNLWMLLFRRDFGFLFIDALLERDKHKKNFLARQLAIMLCDFLRLVHHLTGTGIIPEIQSPEVPQAIQDELKRLLEGLGRLKDRHLQALTELRKVAAAHRNPDGLRQLAAIDAIDVEQLFAIAYDVSVAQEVLLSAWMTAVRTLVKRSLDVLASR